MEAKEFIDLAEQFSQAAADLEPEVMHGSDAVRALEAAAQAEQAGAAVRGRLSKRVEDTNAWRRHGARNAQEWIALKTGLSPGRVGASIRTARELEDQPELREEFATGRLSEDQTRVITDTVKDAPDAAPDLLDTARTKGLKGLREEAARVKAAAVDEDELYARAVKRRHLRGVPTGEGDTRVHGLVPNDLWAEITAAVKPHQDAAFEQARKEGRRESPDAYFLDGLIALTRSKNGGGGGTRTEVHVLVDHRAILRGHTEVGEICEVDGIGPVPVSVAEQLTDDAFISVLLTDGVDVQRVSRPDRHVQVQLRDAIRLRDRTCAVPGCDLDRGLEFDHCEEDFADDGPTAYWNLDRVCKGHHDKKTYEGFRLEGTAGDRDWIDPDGIIVASDRPQRVGTPARGVKRRPPDNQAA